jgi:beta-glucosidase
VRTLWGNYCGTASRTVTPLQGIRERLPAPARLFYAEGCQLQGTELDTPGPHGNITEAVLAARRAQVTVLVLGLSPLLEGEEGDAKESPAAGDKLDLELPGLQQQLLEAVVGVGKPVVVVLVSGSPLAVSFAEQRAAAIIQAFYPGEEGGSALAEVLFGDVSPAGRPPITYPRALSDLPPFEDYAMRGRTYRYLEREPLFPFGFGLSFTRFEYRNLSLTSTQLVVAEDLSIGVTVEVSNTGGVASDEVVQLYVRRAAGSSPRPHHELRGFQRLHLAAGAAARIEFTLTAKSLSRIDDSGARLLEPGAFQVFIGGSQPDARSVALLGQSPLAADLELTGSSLRLAY